MAQSSATLTGDFSGFLSPEQAAPYFEEAARQSVVQSLTRQVPLGINGQEVPVVTEKPTAGWVAEGGAKPATEGGIALKTLTPKKLAAISVVSAEVVRANPGNYMELLRGQIAEAFAIAFDAATLHGTNTPFGATNVIGGTTKAIELGTATKANGGMFADFNDALAQLVEDGHKLTGWAFDNVAEPVLNSAVDSAGRPLFVESVYERSALDAGRLLRRPALYADGVAGTDSIGFAGDWSQAVWGTVGGISFDVSTETAVTIGGKLTSLWEHNLVAIRAEAEYGFLVNDQDAFVEIREKAATSG